jgi:hypothetical protein
VKPFANFAREPTPREKGITPRIGVSLPKGVKVRHPSFVRRFAALVLAVLYASSSITPRFAIADDKAKSNYVLIQPNTDAATKLKIKKILHVQSVKRVEGFSNVEIWRLNGAAPSVDKFGSAVSLLGEVKGNPTDLFSSVIPAENIANTNIPPAVQKRINEIAKASKGAVKVVTFDGLTELKLTQSLNSSATAHTPGANVVRFNADLGQRRTLALTSEGSTKDDAGATHWRASLRQTTTGGTELPAFLPDAELPSAVGSIALSYANGTVYGEIDINGKPYSIQPVGSGYHVLAPVDWGSYPEGHPVLERRPKRDAAPPQGLLEHAHESPVTMLAADAAPPPPSCSTTPQPTIRVGFAVTPSALTDLNWASVTDPLVTSWIGATLNSIRTGFSAANISVAIQSSGAYAYSGTQELDSSDPTAQWQNQFVDFSNDSGVVAFRRTNSADVMVLIAHLSLGYGCGSSPMDQISGKGTFDPTLGFTLVSSLSPCIDPTYLTIMHEIGHQLGLAHDQYATAPPTISAIDPEARGFASVSGTSLDGSKVTVEGYSSSCARKIITLNPGLTPEQQSALTSQTQSCGRVPRWSNTQLDPVEGKIGQAGDADSARVLPRTVTYVCAYKQQLQ